MSVCQLGRAEQDIGEEGTLTSILIAAEKRTIKVPIFNSPRRTYLRIVNQVAQCDKENFEIKTFVNCFFRS